MGRSHVEVVEDCLLQEGPHIGAGEECDKWPPAKEGTAEICDEPKPIPHLPALLGDRR